MGEQALDFNGLVEKYGRRIFNLAFRITGSRREAEVVVQETFQRYRATPPELRGDGDGVHRLYRSALRSSLLCARKLGGTMTREALEETIVSLQGEVPAEVREWKDDQSRAPFRRALLSELNQACLQSMTYLLTDEHRVVYVMRAILDFTFAEIAEVLEAPTSVVESRFQGARAEVERAFAGTCRWLDPDHGTCSCESRIGFALALDPEIPRRVRMQALKTETDAVYTGYVARPVRNITDLYRRLPHLGYKTAALKKRLADPGPR
jgi:RNA polymerase sigma-70 factor (ECF subfamily)